MHGNMAAQLLWIGAAMIVAAVFGALARRLNQPRVLGALVGGLTIGILFTNTGVIHSIRAGNGAELVSGLSEVAAMMLLFFAGLEGNLHSIIRDARMGWKVAVIGVIVPMAGGFIYTFYAVDVPWPVALFQGGVFAATSVGITAAVLAELGVMDRPFAKVIISAAVIDDVLGLVVLAVCQALIKGGINTKEIVAQILIAGLFVTVIPIISHYAAPFILKTLHRFDPQAREALVLGWMFLYGAAALYVGLAAIVGAYFAGVALEETYFTQKDGAVEKEVEHFVGKLIVGFGPIFFVYAGCVVDPAVFLNPTVLLHGLAFTAIAIVGKLFAGIVVPAGQRLVVGVGMSPRGEVGIIFATIGLNSNILTPELFGASMIMVLLTTLITPPALGNRIAKMRSTPTFIPHE